MSELRHLQFETLDAAVEDELIEPFELTLVKVYGSSDPDHLDDMSQVVGFTVR